MADIFYQALKQLKPFEVRKNGLLSVDFSPLEHREKYFVGRIKIDFIDSNIQYKSQLQIKIHKHEVRVLKRFCNDILKELNK
jgi:hypothetical protein